MKAKVIITVMAMTLSFFGVAIAPDLASASISMINPRVAPPQSHPVGMTYGEWAGPWWAWAVGIPATENPILDETGEFGDIDQAGPVWFLAGTFGGTAERTVTIPQGKLLFFPILNSLWWAPDDLPIAADIVATYLGLDPANFSDEELIRLVAIFEVTFGVLEMTCTVDGIELSNLEQYFAESPGFQIIDTDLLDDLGAHISQPNTAVSAGYYIMLPPLSAGEHTIQFTVNGSGNPLLGDFALDVTYYITVE